MSFTFLSDAELICDNPRNAEAGISTILLRAGKNPGTVKIMASAEGLASGEIEIRTN